VRKDGAPGDVGGNARTQLTLAEFQTSRTRRPKATLRGASSPASGKSPHPSSARWIEEVDRFVREWQRRRSIGERWQRGLRYTLGRLPVLLQSYGAGPPISSPNDVVEGHVALLRSRTGWSRATTQFYFAGLRQFLRWSGNALAETPEAWRLPPGSSPHRRWITREDLAILLRSAVGPARLIIALEGFNGLRRIEVLRLRGQDVNLSEGWLNVRGKGRMGGKWRQIPLSGIARVEVQGYLARVPPDSRILPYSASWADQQLAGAAKRAGFPSRNLRVSHHDLRRTFGRVAHDSGMDLVQLKNLFGHSNLDMSVHYIGLDLDRMREGLGQIDRVLTPLVQDRGKRRISRRAPMRGSRGSKSLNQRAHVAPAQ
jgi:integrase